MTDGGVSVEQGSEHAMKNQEVMADAVESAAEIVRVLRDELAANDGTALAWRLGERPMSGVGSGVGPLSLARSPVNDDGFVAELALTADGSTRDDADALLAADQDFTLLCDARRDEWIARHEVDAGDAGDGVDEVGDR
jgi:hypothetical protein